MNTMGLALECLGDTFPGVTHLDHAVRAYEAALVIYTSADALHEEKATSQNLERARKEMLARRR